MRRYPLAWFFTLAYTFSWAVWIPAAAASLGLVGSVPSVQLHFLGGLGPMASSLFITALVGGQGALARLAGRTIRKGMWIVIAIAMPAIRFVFSALLVAYLYRTPIDWRVVGDRTEATSLPRPILWLVNLVCYGYGEEVGWRGFALPRFQQRRSALRASLLVTLGWAGRHIPLFAFSSASRTCGPLGRSAGCSHLPLGSILMTSLFNSSNGSIAAVAFFHAALDIFMTSPVSPQLPNAMGALLTIGTVPLIPIVGPQHLARRQRVTVAVR